MGWFAATPTFAPLKLPVKTMRIKNTTASEKKTSGNLPPSFEELLFLSIDSDLTSLLDIIEFKSNNTGYCFGSDKELAKLLKQSISSIKKKLKRLSDLGAIFRIRISRNKKGGSRRIIFTNKNYQNRDQILAAFPPNKIIGVRNSLNYIHPDAQKILSSVSMISTPIYYGNNASISTIKTPSNSTSLSTSLPSAINRANHLYDKKVVNKAIPQKAKPLPPFQTKNTQIKDYIKMSDDEKHQLLLIYGDKMFHKFNAQAIKFLEKLKIQGKDWIPDYKLGEEGLTRKYCEAEQSQRAASKKRKEAMEQQVYIEKQTPEEKNRDRAKKEIELSKLSGLIQININCLVVNVQKIDRNKLNDLPCYQLSYAERDFDGKLDMLLSCLKQALPKSTGMPLNRPALNYRGMDGVLSCLNNDRPTEGKLDRF